MGRGKPRKKKRTITRSNKPGTLTPQEGQARKQAAVEKQTEQLNQIVSLILRALAPRMNNLETSLTSMIERNAVYFRLLFDQTGVDVNMRQSALREMHIIKEIFTLVNVIAGQHALDTAEGILMELANIGIRDDEYAPKSPITIVFVWLKPGEEASGDKWPAHTICMLPGDGIKFDVGAITPEREEGDLAFIFVDKGAFLLAAEGRTTAELEYMDRTVGTDAPGVVGKFIFGLDLDNYFTNLKREATERNRHPEGAQMFGGNS